MLGPTELSTAGAPLLGVSAEDYLISRSNCADPLESEAWLLTAKTLFPTSFSVQFAIYGMYKDSQRYAEAAGQLTDLLISFGAEPSLWPEMRLVAAGANAGAPPQENGKHALVPMPATGSPATSAIFAQLTPHSQYALLLAVCGRATDVADRCRCTLLLLRRFPDSITEHGGPLIEELLATQRGVTLQGPVMALRRLLVCEVLPLVLPRLQLPLPLTVELLELAITYYVRNMPPVHVACRAMMSSTSAGTPTTATAGASGANQTPKSADDPKETWTRLFELCRLIASKLKWTSLQDLLEGSCSLSDQQLARLKAVAPQSGDVVDLSRSRSGSKSAASSAAAQAALTAEADRTQRFYVTLVLFLRSVYFYGCYTATTTTSGDTGEVGLPGCVLVDFREPIVQPPKKKKLLEKQPGQIAATPHLPSDVAISLIGHFQIAVRCWNTLATVFKPDTDRLFEMLGLAEVWKAFLGMFSIDAAVYQNQMDEALQLGATLIGELAAAPTDCVTRIKANLRMVSCLFATGDKETALTRLTETLTLMLACPDELKERPRQTSKTTPTPNPAIVPLETCQQFCFVVCTRDDILQFFVRLLMTLLKERLTSDQRDDVAIGNLIVLSQANWPAHEAQITQLLGQIRRAKAFAYPVFMNYVVVADILEEFAFLASEQQQEIQLDLLPATQGTGSRSRTVTRGVNKGAREELRAAMEKQMGRANEDVAQVIIAFLLNERHLLSLSKR